jgi:hypothetical protein
MPWSRAGIVACCGLSLAACIYDGLYIVRGHVRATDEPVEGAVVRVSGREGGAVTGADGGFELHYAFGGMFPFTWSDGSPRVEVEAPGFTPVAFPLRGADQPGVIRRTCVDRGCFDLDVVLRPPNAVDAQRNPAQP